METAHTPHPSLKEPGSPAVTEPAAGADALDAALDAWQALEQRLARLGQLFVAEVRLAANSGAWIGILTIVGGGLLLSTWLVLLATAGYFAWQAGWAIPAIGLAVAGLNLVATGLAVWAIVRLSRYLTLPHLRAERKAVKSLETLS